MAGAERYWVLAHAASLLSQSFDRSLTEAGWVDRLRLSPTGG